MLDPHKLAKLGSVMDHLSLAELQQVSNMVVERMKMRSPAAAIASAATAAAALAPPVPPPVTAAPAAFVPVPFAWLPSPRGTLYSVGDRVEFIDTKSRPRRLVAGLVKQVNGKSVSMIPDDGSVPWWRVSPGLLRLVAKRGATKLIEATTPLPVPALGTVVTPADVDHLFGRKGHMPTAEGAGAW